MQTNGEQSVCADDEQSVMIGELQFENNLEKSSQINFVGEFTKRFAPAMAIDWKYTELDCNRLLAFNRLLQREPSSSALKKAD